MITSTQIKDLLNEADKLASATNYSARTCGKLLANFITDVDDRTALLDAIEKHTSKPGDCIMHLTPREISSIKGKPYEPV